MRTLLLFLLLLLPVAAHAERVVEVQNIKVEQAKDRDEAVLKATRAAAAQVWGQLNPSVPTPEFTPAQLDAMTSYVDIADEVVRPNFYAATFSLGIRSSAVSRDAYEPDEQDTSAPISSAEGTKPPAWVLIVPARESMGVSKIWDATDPWAQAWVRAPAGRVPTATAQSDPQDAQLLPAARVQGDELALAESLAALAQKYSAPAVALVLLQSPRDALALGDELTVQVLYLRDDGSEQASSQSAIFISASNATTALSDAVTEAIRQLGDLALPSAEVPAATTPAPDFPVAGQPGLSANYGAQSGTGLGLGLSAAPTNKVSVRIPLSSPADLANYRKKIDTIPGAHFEITTLNRSFVEGNIVYAGDQAVLMQKLTESGLRQQ
jgi:hypothetical protein